ncbi:UNVERIFIED_ORG: hypothetical protein C7430_11176 [Pantoea agglomerans]|uniref:Uncharacterized protein n=1 Tax=Enterobacter agglomerans TaxID=549 RepID=A0ABD6XR75_ENTAG
MLLNRIARLHPDFYVFRAKISQLIGVQAIKKPSFSRSVTLQRIMAITIRTALA